jgi:hypothetical protein
MDAIIFKWGSMEKGRGKNEEPYRRRRKAYLVLPLPLVLLMTIFFYALGGGRGDGGNGNVTGAKGLNMTLPHPKPDRTKKALSKMGLYQQSEEDSVRIRASRKLDPYYDTAGWRDGGQSHARGWGRLSMEPPDAQAGEMLGNLDRLKERLRRQEQDAAARPLAAGPLTGRPFAPTEFPVGRGQSPWRTGAVPPTFPADRGDPDIDKLNGLMDKVLKVRYPGLVRDTVFSVERVAETLSVPVRAETVTTLAGDGAADDATGFIDLDDGHRADSAAVDLIAAVVDGAQTLVSGEAVTLRTAQEAVIGGLSVPRGTALSGKASLAGERLMMNITSVRIGSQVRSVALEVIDMDGMPGIRVRGSINRDVVKESADEAVSSVGVTPMDASVAGQATAAGLQTARTLLSRKVRLVRVGLPAGYKVLLRNVKVNR